MRVTQKWSFITNHSVFLTKYTANTANLRVNLKVRAWYIIVSKRWHKMIVGDKLILMNTSCKERYFVYDDAIKRDNIVDIVHVVLTVSPSTLRQRHATYRWKKTIKQFYLPSMISTCKWRFRKPLKLNGPNDKACDEATLRMSHAQILPNYAAALLRRPLFPQRLNTVADILDLWSWDRFVKLPCI